MIAYYDTCATTVVDERVAAEVLRLMTEEFGNSGSRTHTYGQDALAAVGRARRQVADVVAADPNEVIFTSGATEADNMAILGLAPEGERSGRRHIISSPIEHRAVLEPLGRLREQGFEIDLVPIDSSGRVDPAEVTRRLRPDTLLVSVMHGNNETGVLQPIDEVAAALAGNPVLFHVDAAQTFGKVLEPLRNPRVDLISVSAHKVFAPKGVGALIARRRNYKRPPLTPLLVGGGQERGLRPGTAPVPLIAGFGLGAELAVAEHDTRRKECLRLRTQVLEGLSSLDPFINGDQSAVLPHVLNLSIPGADAEAVMVAWRDLVAISNGSACTSASYEPSHVLLAMGLSDEQVRGALRISWSHFSPAVDWAEAAARVRGLF
ncbi:aminotransferase class V-fold PLP-dependent enzyme [Frankia sp. CcI49]|uniref:aminotransferase class V-fold PLP-dependent enzyme n=1 Tax=Frankia sp. CcI49 TaxID=1745382 RepID=UPI000A0524B0|nr:aminotransferase class V-fold PLP-dependent enzyme [Frankia sp. CcI49]